MTVSGRTGGGRLLALVLAAGCVAGGMAGCPGPGSGNGVAGANGAVATELGDEPRVTPGVDGAAWLEAVHVGFHERWADSFLEDCRRLLPASNPLNQMQLSVELELVLAADGKLAAMTVARVSGVPDFDRAATEIVRDTTFPAPPRKLLSDDARLHVTWLFARDARRAAAANATLHRIRWAPGKAVPSLLRAGRTRDAALRVAQAATADAADAGGQQRDEVTHLLRDVASAAMAHALAKGEPTLRVNTARSIGAAGWKLLAPQLRELATKAPDVALQKAALAALGDVGDIKATGILLAVTVALDGDRSVTAAAALAKLDQRSAAWASLEAKLGEPDSRAAAVAVVAALGEPKSVPALVAILRDNKAPRTLRALAAQGLGVAARGRLGPATRQLALSLRDGNAAVRLAAASGLARAGDDGLRSKSLFFQLDPVLRDRDPRVRGAVARAIFAVARGRGVNELALAVRRETNVSALVECIGALSGLSGPEVLRTLQLRSKHKNLTVRQAALRGLAGHSSAVAKKTVRALLNDSDPTNRVIAVSALRDKAGLAKALADESAEVRAAAVRALVTTVGARAAVGPVAEALAAARSPGEMVLLCEAWLTAAI